MDQARTLRALQDADLAILRAKSRYDNLPEKAQLATVRKKVHEVLVKQGQVSDLKAECEDRIEACQKEIEDLDRKISEKQRELDSTSNHRLIAGLTKDMEGAVKRREKVDFQMNEHLARLEKIEAVEAQVKAAAARLDAAESELAAFVAAQAKEMHRVVSESQELHRAYAAELDKDLLERYLHLARTKGGVGVADFADDRCSACNLEFHEGERQRIARGPAINTCPRCGRLLIRDAGEE
ncbi:MAG: hypothetical protein II128_04510 [Atopobiaceae bacterium]|jgi:predicted  nucleic acid-binding Zn-ribbon protein|nr:hypothetical protein [Atopobiaceae bacterium]